MGDTREEGNIGVAGVCSQLSVSLIGLLLIVLGPAVTNAACTAGPGAYCITASSPPDPCPEGYFCLGGATDKRQCWPGTYSDTKNATSNSTCRACKSGKFSGSWAAASNASCSDCVQGKYSGSGATECSSCPAGSYSETIGAASNATCRPCAAPAGNFCPSAFQGPVTGTTCPPGYFCPGGTSDKVPWACTAGPGAYCITASSPPDPCPEGYFCLGGATDKRQCWPGTYSDTKGATSNSTCRDCKSGKFSGSWAAASNASCSDCVQGKYSSSGGATECSSCPAGSYSETIGATSIATCKPCAAPAGNFCPSAFQGPVTGTTCPPGYFCPGGTSDKVPCPQGKRSPALGASSIATCSACSAGWSSNPGDAQCSPCDLGRYSEYSGGNCTQCPPGKYSDVQGAENCKLCDRGKYSGATGGVSRNTCQDCVIVPPGFFCDAGSATQSGAECLPGYQCVGGQIIECIGGSFSRAGASECTLCAAGTYSELKKATRCNDCPACQQARVHVLKYALTCCNDCGDYAEGTYSATRGNRLLTSCRRCVDGKYSGAGSNVCAESSLWTFMMASQADPKEGCPMQDAKDPKLCGVQTLDGLAIFPYPTINQPHYYSEQTLQDVTV